MPNAGFNATTDQSDDWQTPGWLFKALDLEFAFDFDAAASVENHKVELFTGDIEEYGVPPGARVFCNPPYSNILPFVVQALSGVNLWVFILPVRTRSAWFEHLCGSPRVEFRWLRKRIAFDPPSGVEPSSPRMDTFIAVVRPVR
jgi:phage N-6-adenine-methyltransferase